MTDPQFDLIVVGGGPGGSTVATLVAKRGHKVLLLEREKLPRYQIGESTLPYTLGICKILGVADDLAKAGFTSKLGGIWRWGTRGNVVHVDFRNVVPEPLIEDAYAYQVERIKFDGGKESMCANGTLCGNSSRKRGGSWGQNGPMMRAARELPGPGILRTPVGTRAPFIVCVANACGPRGFETLHCLLISRGEKG